MPSPWKMNVVGMEGIEPTRGLKGRQGYTRYCS